MQQLFTNQTANGNSAAIDWPGGRGELVGFGTWDTSTMTLQMSPDGGTTWITTGQALTADGHKSFQLTPCKLRLNLASVGASTDVNGQIRGV